MSNATFTPARLDRRVSAFAAEEAPVFKRISDLAGAERYILLGEPGSGKSTVFAQAAADAGTSVVRARDIVDGDWPAGPTVFIDALEEYRIGEAGRERVHDVAKALKASPYRRWRIACRSISLPPDVQSLIRTRAGEFELWQLELLDATEQVAVLQSLGEADPIGFRNKIHAMGSETLMGNPATLRLLRRTALDAAHVLETRGQLLQEATRQMAQEVNADLLSDPQRPTADRITEAAEKANLVMLLSVREDLWAWPAAPAPSQLMVTVEDLIPAGVDTQALRYALGSAMFRGEGGAYQASHRLVAEYLAGRALAHATAPTKAGVAALSVERGLAFLTGDNGAPAPALTGVYAWFVTTLANTQHHAQALKLVEAAPESLLFHGDPALLPQSHRRALLAVVGRSDPWFLRTARGSSALGGLAGEDLAPELKTVLADPAESSHRRIMVLRALATGRRTPSLLPVVWDLAVDASQTDWVRREAADAYVHQAADELVAGRDLFDAIAGQSDSAAVVMRLELLTPLVQAGEASVVEIRSAIAAYELSPESLMGFLYLLSETLAERPMWRLFNRPFGGGGGHAGARRFETRSAAQRVLAATVRAFPQVDAARLVRWIDNGGPEPFEPLDEAVRTAVGEWLDADPGRAARLFWTLAQRPEPHEVWRAQTAFQRLTGRTPPAAVREAAVEHIATLPDLTHEAKAVAVAQNLICPWTEWSALYWRLYALLEHRPGGADAFKGLTVIEIDDTLAKYNEQAKLAAKRRDEVWAGNVAWFNEHQAAVKWGAQIGSLVWAAEVYFGYHHALKSEAFEARLRTLLGVDNTQAILAGWDHVVANFPVTLAEQGAHAGRRKIPQVNHVAVAWAHHALLQGRSATVSLDVAFALLQSAHMVEDQDRRPQVVALALDAVANAPNPAVPVLAYWKAALAVGAGELPGLRDIEAHPVAALALASLLTETPRLPGPVLDEAISAAVRLLPAQRLRGLAAHGLARVRAKEARQRWSMLSFFLDPARFEPALIALSKDPEGPSLIAGDLGRAMARDLVLDGPTALIRDTILIEQLGPRFPPEDDQGAIEGRASQVVASAIEALAGSPTSDASERLGRLANRDDLQAWRTLLQHQRQMQQELRRKAEFKPPQPGQVATALLAGPPATPADLRAVVREALIQLKADLRRGDTAPWRGFWNRPQGKGAKTTPKIENDCRDLITDRLRDRLLRFNIPVRRSTTEARSQSDRRADLLVVGENEAALPVEAKRHWNPELWTAPKDQLLPYAETVGASGHGVYLIFWFGEAYGCPTSPRDGVPVTSVDALQAALEAHLTAPEYARIAVVVLDLSEPELTDKQKAAKAAKTTTKNTARSPKTRTAKAKPVQAQVVGIGNGTTTGAAKTGRTRRKGASSS